MLVGELEGRHRAITAEMPLGQSPDLDLPQKE